MIRGTITVERSRHLTHSSVKQSTVAGNAPASLGRLFRACYLTSAWLCPLIALGRVTGQVCSPAKPYTDTSKIAWGSCEKSWHHLAWLNVKGAACSPALPLPAWCCCALDLHS